MIMIMSFCKKGLHSFLGFNNLADSPPPMAPALQSSSLPPPASKGHPLPSAVGLCTATLDLPRGPHVVESTVVYSLLPSKEKDPGGFGLVDEIGGGVVDGLLSCTESLGFESSDGLGAEVLPTQPVKAVERMRWREESEKRREKKFPPPISSLNHKGQRSFSLRPLRTEGRLELTEVRIDRPEILRASREDGRLRLDLIVDEDMEIEEQEQETMEENGEKHEDVQDNQYCISERFQEEPHEVAGWKIAVSREGFGRCHEVVNHHSRHRNHHNLHDVWRQPCVPTR